MVVATFAAAVIAVVCAVVPPAVAAAAADAALDATLNCANEGSTELVLAPAFHDDNAPMLDTTLAVAVAVPLLVELCAGVVVDAFAFCVCACINNSNCCKMHV